MNICLKGNIVSTYTDKEMIFKENTFMFGHKAQPSTHRIAFLPREPTRRTKDCIMTYGTVLSPQL